MTQPPEVLSEVQSMLMMPYLFKPSADTLVLAI